MQINLVTRNSGPKQIDVAPIESTIKPKMLKVYNQVLKYSNVKLQEELNFRNVRISEKYHMHELYTRSDPSLPHIVLLHGFGGTSLTYIRLFEHLKDHYQVHALDTYGVGISSRGNMDEKLTAEETEHYFTNAIEEWRKAVGIKKMHLAGHSFGGYIASLYFERYSQNVEKLILLSPVGITQKTIDEANKQLKARNMSGFFTCIAEKIYNMNFRPSKIMDSFIIGDRMMDRVLEGRLKLQNQEKEAWKAYFKQVIKGEDTSEVGFYKLFDWPVVAKKSIEGIIRNSDTKIPIEIYFGDTDWMDRVGGKRLIKDLPHVNLGIISNAGHQLLFDNPKEIAERLTKRDDKFFISKKELSEESN